MSRPSSVRGRALFVSNVAWDHLWQRHQAMACLFARDYDVTFCEIPGVRRVGLRDLERIVSRFRRVVGPPHDNATGPARPRGLVVVRPFVVPSTNAFFHGMNRLLVARFLRRHDGLRLGVDVIVTYTAARAAARLVAAVPRRALIYDCTDNFSAVRGVPACLVADERQLVASADLTLVSGATLAAMHGPHARRLEVLPHGAAIDRFFVDVLPPTGPVSLVYYGHLHRQHFDDELVAEIARRRPAWRIVLVGPAVTPFEFPPNVALAGPQPHEKLCEFVAAAHAIVLPYVLNDYTRAVLPAKTYECLATGRPVVATPLPELQAAAPQLIAFAADADAFIAAIEREIAVDTPDRRTARVAEARLNSWDARYERVRALLAELGLSKTQ